MTTSTVPAAGNIVSITMEAGNFGSLISGVVTETTDTAITVKRSNGKTETIQRDAIEYGAVIDANGALVAEFGNSVDPAPATPASEHVTVTDPDKLMGTPAYDGPADQAHTALAAGHYVTTDGRGLVVNGEHSMIAGPALLSLDSGIYFLLDPANPDNSWRNLGVTPDDAQWEHWNEIEWAGVGDDEEELLAAIALAVRTGAPEDIAAARAADAKYAAILAN